MRNEQVPLLLIFAFVCAVYKLVEISRACSRKLGSMTISWFSGLLSSALVE